MRSQLILEFPCSAHGALTTKLRTKSNCFFFLSPPQSSSTNGPPINYFCVAGSAMLELPSYSPLWRAAMVAVPCRLQRHMCPASLGRDSASGEGGCSTDADRYWEISGTISRSMESMPGVLMAGAQPRPTPVGGSVGGPRPASAPIQNRPG
jgi:hypothetical protein